MHSVNMRPHPQHCSMIERLFPICIIFELLVCELYCASVSTLCLLLLSRS